MVLGVASLVMLAGLLMWALCVNQKLAWIGIVMFGVGLLCFLSNVGTVLPGFPTGRTTELKLPQRLTPTAESAAAFADIPPFAGCSDNGKPCESGNLIYYWRLTKRRR
jgi:hypothetical protein